MVMQRREDMNAICRIAARKMATPSRQGREHDIKK